MALFVQFEVFRRNPQLTQNKIYIFHSISWGFQLYKLTSFNWNIDSRFGKSLFLKVSIVQTYILQLKRTPFSAAQSRNVVSIVQTYILQLKLKERIHVYYAGTRFQLYKLTSFNWNTISSGVLVALRKFQLYKLTSFNWNKARSFGDSSETPFQLYKLTSFNWNESGL